MTREATVLIVPGLRGHVPQHWQTLLASRLPRVRTVEPMGRDLDCARKVAAIEREANAIKVKLGVASVSTIQVLDGLQPGDQVIVQGVEKVKDGTSVVPKPANVQVEER